MIPSGPKDTYISGSHTRSAFSKLRLDLESCGSLRSSLSHPALRKHLPECCNLCILTSIVITNPSEFSVMALLPHAWSPIAPTVFGVLSSSNCVTDVLIFHRSPSSFPTSLVWSGHLLVHLEGPVPTSRSKMMLSPRHQR